MSVAMLVAARSIIVTDFTYTRISYHTYFDSVTVSYTIHCEHLLVTSKYHFYYFTTLSQKPEVYKNQK